MELIVYYEFVVESMKRKLKIKPIYECRCDERLKPYGEESTCLVYTELLEELYKLATLVILQLLFIMDR